MRMGFLTNNLVNAGLKSLDVLARWGVENGFTDLEVGPTIPLVEDDFHRAKEVWGVDINTLIFCRNFLMSDKDTARALLNNLQERVIFAGKIGAKQVVTTTGVLDKSHSGGAYRPELSLDAFQQTFDPIIDLAEKHNVDILFEVCPFMGNIAISPFMWELIFNKVKSDRVGIAYDPSHFVWQFIDPYTPITKFASKIRHIHGKDCETNLDMLKQTGIMHMYSPEHVKGAWTHKDAGLQEQKGQTVLWWRYRLPGLGQLDWDEIISRLYEVGYCGTISIEHEDPVWDGDENLVKCGIIAAKEHIKQYLYDSKQ